MCGSSFETGQRVRLARDELFLLAAAQCLAESAPFGTVNSVFAQAAAGATFDVP